MALNIADEAIRAWKRDKRALARDHMALLVHEAQHHQQHVASGDDSNEAIKECSCESALPDLLRVVQACGLARRHKLGAAVFTDDESKEIESDTTLEIAKSISTYSKVASFDHWVGGVWKNCAKRYLDRQRRERDRLELRSDITAADGQGSRFSSLIANQLALDEALERTPNLSAQERQALRFLKDEEQNIAEVGRRLGVPYSTAYDIVVRASNKVRLATSVPGFGGPDDTDRTGPSPELPAASDPPGQADTDSQPDGDADARGS